jgi:hypothetical protein
MLQTCDVGIRAKGRAPNVGCCTHHRSLLGVNVGGIRISGQNPRTRGRKESGHVQFKYTDDVKGEKESPKDCPSLKSCESSYTCPRARFYRETKGLLHSENTLELEEYSQCEHVHECLLHLIHLQACH